jgi:hypothetical protein
MGPGARPDGLLSDGVPQRVYINGSLTPAPKELEVGRTYRLRIADIAVFRQLLRVRLVRDSALLAWRPIAKDGFTLPPAQATVRPSVVNLPSGETADFEFTPDRPGELALEVWSGRRASGGTRCCTGASRSTCRRGWGRRGFAIIEFASAAETIAGQFAPPLLDRPPQVAWMTRAEPPLLLISFPASDTPSPLPRTVSTGLRRTDEKPAPAFPDEVVGPPNRNDGRPGVARARIRGAVAAESCCTVSRET